MKDKVAIVGAGVGGLAAAARLASRGYTVEVFEKLERCGGRCNIIEDKGFKFDTGPSFILMPDFFKEVFSYCGERLEDHLDFRPLDISYKIFYADGETLSVHKDSERTKEELERIESGSSRGFDGFLKETANIYQALEPLLYKCFSRSSLFKPSYWPLINKIRPFSSYWDIAAKFFKSDKLRYAFTFEAMFIGVSPFQAPGFYSIISYADHAQKIYHPMGGMYQVALALEKLSAKFGAKINYLSQVKRLSRNNGKLILELDRDEVTADKVVINADYAYAQERLLGRRLPKFSYSCSVYLIYLGLRKRIPRLAHHNLFFAKDLRRNLDEIFRKKVISRDPSFYIHVPTVTDPSLAPVGGEILYVLIPVPNLENEKESIVDHQDRLRRLVLSKVREVSGIDPEELIETEQRFYPQDFILRYNIKQGATFGLAHNLMQSAFFRPPNYDSHLKGLYFCGASSQPGGGLPVVIASSRIVADLIDKGRKG